MQSHWFVVIINSVKLFLYDISSLLLVNSTFNVTIIITKIVNTKFWWDWLDQVQYKKLLVFHLQHS